jgi:hypothetical protein
MKEERQDETQFTTKIGGKTSLGPSYFCFVKLVSINPSYIFDVLLCQNWPFAGP